MRAIVIINLFLLLYKRITMLRGAFNQDILKGIFHDHYRIGNRQSR